MQRKVYGRQVMHHDKMKRISRACVRCRRHKAKCILQRSGHMAEPPCQKCVQAGVECVLATSNRGGRRRSTAVETRECGEIPVQDLSRTQRTVGTHLAYEPINVDESPSISPLTNIDLQHSIEETLASANLHNTSDALNILNQFSGSSSVTASDCTGLSRLSPAPTESEQLPQDVAELRHFYLVHRGFLTAAQVCSIVEQFSVLYHPFYPISPARALMRTSLSQIAKHEPHLLTAILTVGSKNMVNGRGIHKACADHMQTLIKEIIAGKKCGVEVVEALLLLAEWEPQGILVKSEPEVCGQEDMAAWMHIGLAIRIAYELRLDRTIFNYQTKIGGASSLRERFAWIGKKPNALSPLRDHLWQEQILIYSRGIACYLSDRQISVRVGRPFACRGLEPSLVLGQVGFLTINAQSNGEDDLASIFRARLELTKIFSDVHELLYCNMNSDAQMMRLGGYSTFVDGFREAIASWNKVWGSLTCSTNVKVLLQISYEYLRLYTNAFPFQATTLRKLSPQTLEAQNSRSESIAGMGSLPEGRFMFESIDAAKSLLTIMNNYIQSPALLSRFPVRIPIYCINAAVFLYKTYFTLSETEKSSTLRLIRDTIHRLHDGSCSQSNLGTRYAQLLEVLWSRVEDAWNPSGVGIQHEGSNSQNIDFQEYGYHRHDSSSWLDLEEIGDFVREDSIRHDGNRYDLLPPIEAQASSLDWNDTLMMTNIESPWLF